MKQAKCKKTHKGCKRCNSGWHPCDNWECATCAMDTEWWCEDSKPCDCQRLVTKIKWKDVNLPWSDSGAYDYATMPKEPDISDRTREKFGMTEHEAFQKYILEDKRDFKDPEYRKLSDSISDWKHEQPEYVEWHKSCDKWYAQQDQIKKDNPTFRSLGLNKPGTLIKLEDDSIHLIGSINEIAGVCDDCVEFNSKTIIKEYAVVYEWKDSKDAV